MNQPLAANILLLAATAAQSPLPTESPLRSLANPGSSALPQNAGAYESRTHEDRTKDEWAVTFLERLVMDNGDVVIRMRSVGHDASSSYSELRFDSNGEPLLWSQEGPWGNLVSSYAPDGVLRTIDGEERFDAIERRTLANPTVFWFWRVQPKPDESVTVTVASANNPSVSKIKFTYLGTEEIEAAGRKVKAHKVREDPLTDNVGKVYTIRWFDERGMDIGRYHKTTTNEYVTKLKAWK